MPTLDEELLQELREYDASKNSPSPRQIQPSQPAQTEAPSDDELLSDLASYDTAKARTVVPQDTGPGWVSDKVRRVGQGAAEGLIGATEGFFNISSKEVNKPFPFANYYGGPGNPAALLNLLAKPRQDSGLSDKLNEWAATARQFKKEQKDVYGANPAMDQDIASAVASGVGSSASGIAAALATRGASLPTYAITALQLYQENFDSAVEAGQDTDTAHKSGMMAMPLAAFEKIGEVRIGKLLRESIETAYTGGKEALKQVLKGQGKKLAGSAIGEGATEGLQESGKQVIENEILGYKDQSLGERLALTGMSTLVGTLAGTVMGSPGAAISLVGNALKTDQPQTTPKAIDESTDQVRQQQPQGTAIPEVQTQPVPTVQQEPQQVPVQVAPVVAENATVQTPLTPPIEAQQISDSNGRPLVPMTGPDNQTHWFTFDGYQPLARGRTEPSFTLVSQEPAPGLTQGGTFYPRSLAGYKPLSPIPTIEEWNTAKQAPQPQEATILDEEAALPVVPDVTAKGLPEIREMIQKSSFPENTKAVFTDMLSQPVMQRPEFAELTVALRNKLAVGGRPAEGIARVAKKLIEISTSKADEKALPHELFHFFYEMLSPNDQALLSRWRLQEIQERYGDDAPAILVSGNMKSRQAYSEGIPMSDYHLINDTEFLAGKFGRQFAEESTARNNPDRDTLLNKIKVWIQELWNAIKRRFQNEPERLAEMQQMYEGILSGKILNNPQSGIKFEESASFVQTPDEAINEGKKQQTAEQQLIEGRHQVAQSADIVKALEKFGVVAMDPEVQAKLRYSDFVGIQASGENLTSVTGQDYRSVQAATPNIYQKTWTARIAGSQARGFDMTLTDVIAQRDAKEKEVTSPSFVNTMLKEMDAKNRTDLADQNTDLMNSVLDTAIAKAEKALRTEAKNERQIDEIKGQIREMNEARSSSVAMHQLVDDMVNVLATTPQGFNLLTDPSFGTRTDIAKVYADLKSSTGQPIHSPTLIKWATFVLQRNKRLLNNFTAASMSTQAPIRAAMTTFENDLTNNLKKSPAKTIKEIRRGTSKMVTEKERAKFAWKVLNKKVMEKLDEYEVLSEAAEVAEQIKADPDFRKLNKEIQTDSGGLGYQQPFEPFIHDTILLPSGRELNVKADHSFANETTEFLSRHKDIEAGIKELQTWLGDPANLDDINFSVHERNLKSLDTYYTGMGLMLPSDKNNMFGSCFGLTMGILNNVVDDIGGRPSYPLQKAVSKYSSAHETMVKWLQKWSPQLTDSRIKAMQSHKQAWGSFSFKNDLVEANNWYHANVGNPLKYSHNTQQGGAKIGDTLPTGQVVTKEDMDAMRMESEAAEDLFKKGQKEFGEIDQPYAMDDLGGFVLFRNSLKPGENGTPRTYSQVAAAVFSESNMLKALEDTQSKDPAISGPAINTVLSLLDEPAIWQKYGPGFVSDRFFKPAQATVFDGPGGALTILKNDALKFPNASAFMREVESLTGYTFDEVKNILIPEWSRPIPTFVREVQIENSSIKNKPVEQKTAFTKSRNEAIAPYTFYEYGFRVGSSLTKFASGIQARAVDRVIQGLTQSRTMLQNLERELESKIERDALISGPGAARRVMKTQAELNKNGENYDRYQNLQRRIRDIDRQLTILNGADFLSADDALGRVIYAVTGPLLGAPSTARNILDGPRYVGWQMDRLLGSHIQAHALSLWYGWVGSNLKNLTKGIYGVGKATLKTLAYGPTVNLVKTLVNPNERNFRGYAKNVMGTWMEEISNMYNQRIKDFANGIIEGTMHELPPGEKEANARLMGSILSQGTLLDESFTRKQKFMLAPLAIWETLFVNPNRKLNPAFGDSMLNAGLIKALRSSWGPLSFYEQQAGKLADMHSKGFRPFDFANPDNPINELASKEIFGNSWVRWITSPEDLRNAVFLFKRGGLDFQRLMLKLVEKRVNGDKTATLLTGRELTDLSNSTIAQANRGGVANNPAFAFSKDPMARFAIPFLNWPFRTLSDLNNMASWSTQVKGQKGKSTEALRLKQAMANSAFIMLPLLSIFGVVVSYGSTWAYRELKKLIYNQELPYPLPHERDGLSGVAKGLGIDMLNGIPLVGGALSMGLNDSTPRASMNPDFVMVQKAKDVIKFWGGVIQTGDITYKLPEFLMGMVPDSRIIVSRLPGFEGKSELNNAANLLRRYGPTDDLKPMGARAGVVATELTPYGDRMANAAIAGDMTSFKQIYDEAVEVATKMGKAKPEQTVKEMFRSRNPYDRVFKSKITDAERANILAKATPQERALIEEVEAKFKAAAESIGASSNFTSEQSEAARSSRSSGPRASLGAIGMAGVAGSIGRTRTTRARTGRGRTRFSSGRTRRRRVSLRTPRGRTRRIRSTVPSARRRRVSLRGLA